MAKPFKAKSRAKINPRMNQMLDYFYGVSRWNKTDALRRAGYKNPNSQLTKFELPAVKLEMARREKKVQERYEVSYDRVVGELARIAFSSVLDFAEIQKDGTILYDFSETTADEMKALGEVSIETYTEGRGEGAREIKRIRVKPWNKLQALQDLMRHAGLSKEKTPFEGAADLVDRILAGRKRTPNKSERLISNGGEDGDT